MIRPAARPALTVPFAAEVSVPGDALLLEQEDWARNTGALTRPRAVYHIDRRVYGDGRDRKSEGWTLMDCGLTNGRLEITLRVYPPRDDVVFRLAASIGRLGNPEYGETEEDETVSYTLTTESTLRHPARRVLSATWLTGPYDAAGTKVAPPPLTIEDGRVLRVAGNVVWGSVRVGTLVPRWTCVLSCEWAEAAAALNAGWSEWAAAYPDNGRPVAHELTPPPGAAEMAASGAECGRSTIISITREGEGEGWPPIAEPADRYVYCDYCKGECDDGYKPK